MQAQIQTNAGVQYLQCMPKDMSTDFSDLSNTYFLADSLMAFDKDKGEGLVQWKRYRLSPRQAFNLNGYAKDSENQDVDNARRAKEFRC